GNAFGSRCSAAWLARGIPAGAGKRRWVGHMEFSRCVFGERKSISDSQIDAECESGHPGDPAIKMKIPTSNIQHPDKPQKIPKVKPEHKPRWAYWRLELDWTLNVGCWMFLSSLFVLLSAPAFAQDRLKTMPGYDHYQRLSREITNAVKLGILTVTWTNEGKAFDYYKDGKRYHYDIAARLATELAPAKTNAPSRTEERRPGG